jgi:hypothetical protein
MGLRVLAPTRDVLGARLGQTLQVVAIYARTGARTAGSRIYPTILLRDIREVGSGGERLADHLWFNQGSVWRNARLVPGDVVTFAARVIEYRTGYWGPNRVRQALEPARCDFRLTHPSGLSVVRRSKSGNGEVS